MRKKEFWKMKIWVTKNSWGEGDNVLPPEIGKEAADLEKPSFAGEFSLQFFVLFDTTKTLLLQLHTLIFCSTHFWNTLLLQSFWPIETASVITSDSFLALHKCSRSTVLGFLPHPVIVTTQTITLLRGIWCALLTITCHLPHFLWGGESQYEILHKLSVSFGVTIFASDCRFSVLGKVKGAFAKPLDEAKTI